LSQQAEVGGADHKNDFYEEILSDVEGLTRCRKR